MTIDKTMAQIIIMIAVGVDFYLEIHGKPVPATISLLTGFFLSHITKPDALIEPAPAKDPKAGNALLDFVIMTGILVSMGCVFTRTMNATVSGRDIIVPPYAKVGDGTGQFNSTTSLRLFHADTSAR